MLLDAALDFAARGLAVFPCLPRAKDPAIARGFYSATTNPECIRRYWRRHDSNIGIRTGAASGFWVLDVDGGHGEASLRALEAAHYPLPATREAITGGGGRHLYFRYSGPVACSAGKVAPGLDVRGDGGYVVAPPSIHPNGRAYCWSVDSADELATAPDWLLTLTRKRPVSISERAIACMPPRQRGGLDSAYGEAALAEEIAALAGTAPGGRNHALNRAAFSLFQLVAGGELDRGRVVNCLIEACHRNRLVHDDGLRSVIATIRSAHRAGSQTPRTRDGR
jgi:Bifunctional DNA primase/polymerase, N-terminal